MQILKMSKKKLERNEKIQAFISLLVSLFAGATIWTNNSLDLLNKLGIENINPGQATVVFLILLTAGLSWFVISIAKKIS